MTVLFLDFDGVVHPERATVDKFFCNLAMLEPWLRQRPHVDVVISSSWREAHPLHELRSFFAEDLEGRIVGVTPVVRDVMRVQVDGDSMPVRFERETEILRWLQASKEPRQAWAALDDQAWLFRPLCPNLVVCDGRVGLTKSELDVIDSILKAASC